MGASINTGVSQKKTSSNNRPTTFDLFEDAIERISEGIQELKAVEFNVSELTGKRAVDCAARLNAQVAGIEKILEPMKNSIKAEALANNESLILGNSYQAEISRSIRKVLNTEKVKEFLGKKLHQFMKEIHVVSVSFEVKE